MSTLTSFLGLRLGKPRLVFEPDSREDVDILVVLQEALRNTGFPTGPDAAAYIVNSTLNIARDLMQKPSPPRQHAQV